MNNEIRYNAETGEFWWIRQSFNNRRDMIKPAGGLELNGYIKIVINGVTVKAHRLAFYCMTGEWPPSCVDHINGVRDDNRWCNLRLATQMENNQNVRTYKSNTSGWLGTYWNKARKKWVAQIQYNRKKYFLGDYDCQAGDASIQSYSKALPSV
jgi:hypothetical protein